ncbi:MAG: hypothetical protein U0414_42140 [Polyangiaceae bacterium]
MGDKDKRKVAAAPNAKVKAFHPEGDPDFVVREKRIVQCVFYAYNSPGMVATQYATRANGLLEEHGMELRLFKPNGSCIDVPGVWGDYDNTPETALGMLRRAKREHDPGPKFLPIIFCSIKKDEDGAGETFPRPTNEKPSSTPAERYILLYANRPSGDFVTLLHEIGHAAGQSGHDEWGIGNPDERYSVMGTPAKVGGLFMGEDGEKNRQDMQHGKWARNTLYKPLVEKIAAAPWTLKAEDCQLRKMELA